jgi:septum formation protein
MQKRKIILASRSPARLELLREAGLKISVDYPDINESVRRGEPVGRYANRLALEKAKKIAIRHKNAVVVGVDTVIALGQRIFGKPKNKKEAVRYLKTLSGKWHKVCSGTVVLDSKSGRYLRKLVVSKVRFARLSKEQIDWYVATGEPLRVAGAYSIQWSGRTLIESVDGCYTNIIGVSVPVLIQMLKIINAI